MSDKIYSIPKPVSVKPTDTAYKSVKRGMDFSLDEWRTFLENAKGEKFLDKAKTLFKDKKAGELDTEKFEELLQKELNHICFLAEVVSDRYNTDIEYQEKAFDNIFYKICTHLALEQSREKLTEWVDKAEKGKAVFVDALMGLGKTYSIVKALGSDLTKSAVIFMPSRRLCYEVYHNLKTEIYRNFPHIRNNYPNVIDKVEVETDFEFKDFHYRDSYFDPVERWTSEYLEDEVYLADGINKTDCPNYKTFIDRFKENWIIKADLCYECDEAKRCRFRLHRMKVPESRIVITTHRQYDYWYENSDIRKWFKNGYKNRDDAVERDFYIVDEDLVLSQCYQPISLPHDETKAFVGTITSFLEQYPDTEGTREKIHSLLGKVMGCDKTALIRPIDSEFKFPSKIKNAWEKSFSKQEDILPETLDWDDIADNDREVIVGNHLEVIESAIRLGFVVQKYKQLYKGKEEQIYRVYFPNPKTYDLSRLPPHVFFDGTMLKDKFLEKKLLNVEFEKHTIEVKPIWQVRLWQNINNDLPRRWLAELEPKVKDFIRQVLVDRGNKHKYLFLTTKAIKKAYLETYLEEKFSNYNYLIMFFGDLKGINDAKDCDVCIMLGSCLLSDAVEITMALEFIQDIFPDQDITLTEGNLWSWKGSLGQRVYRDQYAVIEELAKALRYSEQRQALARTRYLFHDVDFYVVSKDPVRDYDPFLPKAESEQYLSTIFQPRKKRSDSKEEQVRSAIVEYLEDLEEQETASDMDIHRQYGFSRKTIRQYRNDMLEEGILELVGKRYRLIQVEP